MAKNPGTKFEDWIVESLLAFFPDARRTKASGSVWKSGDVQGGPYEIEAKDRATDSVSIAKAVLQRTEKAAKLSGRMPIVATRCNIGTYVTMRWSDFESLLRVLKDTAQQLEDKQNRKNDYDEYC